MPGSARNGKQQGKQMMLWIGIAIAVAVVMFALVQRSKTRAEAEAQRARYEKLRNQKDYTAETFRCTVQFPTGSAHRVKSYDPFSYRGRTAEIATSDDATDGEAWAEFYSLPPGDPVEAFLKECFADVDHPLVRRRLAFLFDYAIPSEVDVLKDKQQILSAGNKDGWQVRLSYIPSPHGVGQVNARQVPRSELRPGDIIAELPTFGIPSNTLSPWIWVGIDDFRSQSERDAFRRAERHALEKLKDQQLEFRKAKERFERMHRHFYLMEAAKAVQPHQIVVLRRFGSVLSEKTPQSAAEIIQNMMGSVRCE